MQNYVIEGVPETYHIANENVYLNDVYDNTIFVNRAIVADSGIENVTFQINSHHRGSDHVNKDLKGGVSVEAITIDNLVKKYGIRNVVAMKIDIEGMEEDALKGGNEWISNENNRPCIILMEANGQNDLQSIQTLLGGYEYNSAQYLDYYNVVFTNKRCQPLQMDCTTFYTRRSCIF